MMRAHLEALIDEMLDGHIMLDEALANSKNYSLKKLLPGTIITYHVLPPRSAYTAIRSRNVSPSTAPEIAPPPSQPDVLAE